MLMFSRAITAVWESAVFIWLLSCTFWKFFFSVTTVIFAGYVYVLGTAITALLSAFGLTIITYLILLALALLAFVIIAAIAAQYEEDSSSCY